MNRNLFKSLALVTAGTSVIGCNSFQKKDLQRPNIIYIMSDDHAYQAVSAYWHGLNEIPNIDLLAKEGEELPGSRRCKLTAMPCVDMISS